MRETSYGGVICTKYGVDGFGWYPSNPNGPDGLCLWWYICRGRETFSLHVSLEVGAGSIIFFGMTVGVKGVP